MDEKEKEIAALRAIYDEEKKVRTWTLPVPVHATRYVRAMLMHVLCTRVRPVTGRCHRCSPPRRPRPAAAQGCGDCAVPSS